MIWILLILALAVIALYGTPWAEHMTNADVKAKTATFQNKPEIEPPKSTHKKADDKEAIRGPGVPAVGDHEPKGAKKPSKVEPSSGVYPDIYGPEQSLVPGGKDSHSASTPSDIPTPPSFSAVMPNAPDVPRPFLNDFSKILNESPV